MAIFLRKIGATCLRCADWLVGLRVWAGGVMLREILPNVLSTIVVLLTQKMAIAVIVEAILSFVNLSISTDDPTWGG